MKLILENHNRVGFCRIAYVFGVIANEYLKLEGIIIRIKARRLALVKSIDELGGIGNTSFNSARFLIGIEIEIHESTQWRRNGD